MLKFEHIFCHNGGGDARPLKTRSDFFIHTVYEKKGCRYLRKKSSLFVVVVLVGKIILEEEIFYEIDFLRKLIALTIYS